MNNISDNIIQLIVDGTYSLILEDTKEAQDYLIGRGFDDWQYLVDEFGIGYSNLKNDPFNGYLIFPVWSDRGLETATGRSIKNQDPIHKHLPGDIKYFYNHEELYDSDQIVIVESPLCALSLLYVDIPAVASLGSGKVPKSYHNFDNWHEVIILPDADKGVTKFNIFYNLSE